MLVCIAVPVILPVFVPLGLAFVHIQRRYVATSREIKRLEAVTRWGTEGRWRAGGMRGEAVRGDESRDQEA